VAESNRASNMTVREETKAGKCGVRLNFGYNLLVNKRNSM
jgi:hypothetical protein